MKVPKDIGKLLYAERINQIEFQIEARLYRAYELPMLIIRRTILIQEMNKI